MFWLWCIHASFFHLAPEACVRACVRVARVPQECHVFRWQRESKKEGKEEKERDGGYNARLSTEMRFLTDRPTNSVVVTAYARGLMATT